MAGDQRRRRRPRDPRVRTPRRRAHQHARPRGRGRWAAGGHHHDPRDRRPYPPTAGGPFVSDPRTTVVVADDHPVFRDGLVGLLTDLGAEVVATAGDGEEAVAAVAAHAPDVVLMDPQMPVLSGLAATERVRREHPETQVLVLTMSADPATIQAA